MAIPEMNGVGAVQGNGNKYELKPQKEQKMGNLPVGDRKSTRLNSSH